MSESERCLFIFAGEHSGDLCGAQLLKALHKSQPGLSVHGVGGPNMRASGMQCFLQMEQFQVMGYSDVLRSLPRLWKLFQSTLEYILQLQPQVVVLIDYPGFNLRLAKALRKRGFKHKIVQYVCPTVWAHGRKRIEQMRQNLDLLLTIFPFEPPYFAHTSLPVHYAGNPVMEAIDRHAYDADWQREIGLEKTGELIALFPGSRQSELKHHIPIQLAAAEMLKRDQPSLQCGISLVKEELRSFMLQQLAGSKLVLGKDIFLVPKKYSYELMQASHTAIAKAGTVTLELALHQIPTVVMFHITWLNRLVLKHLVRLNLPHYSIVNILFNQRVFPELMEQKVTSHSLYAQVQHMHASSALRQACISQCAQLRPLLETDVAGEKIPAASTCAAQAIGRLWTA